MLLTTHYCVGTETISHNILRWSSFSVQVAQCRYCIDHASKVLTTGHACQQYIEHFIHTHAPSHWSIQLLFFNKTHSTFNSSNNIPLSIHQLVIFRTLQSKNTNNNYCSIPKPIVLKFKLTIKQKKTTLIIQPFFDMQIIFRKKIQVPWILQKLLIQNNQF